jgi:hypothetical protein
MYVEYTALIGIGLMQCTKRKKAVKQNKILQVICSKWGDIEIIFIFLQTRVNLTRLNSKTNKISCRQDRVKKAKRTAVLG